MKRSILGRGLICTIFIVLAVLLVSCDNKTNGDSNQTAHTHSFDEWNTIKKESCTEEGVKERFCSCGERQTQTIIATGHSFGEWNTVTPATCTKDGTKERSCVCGEKENQVISSSGHHFGSWSDEKKATCTESGTQIRECTSCNDIERKDIKELGHTTTDGVCDRCYEYFGDDPCSYYGHNPDKNGYCIDCDENAVEYITRRYFWHEDNYFVFLFSLLDEYDFEVAVNATVEMYIKNDDGQIVYEATKTVTVDDYETWYLDDEEWLGASLVIYDSEIQSGTTDTGVFCFEVTVNNHCYFEEYSLEIDGDLPKIEFADLFDLELPALPTSVTNESGNDFLILRITGIEYKFEKAYNDLGRLTISFSGERIDHEPQQGLNKTCTIAWKLLDEDGYVISTGTTYTSALAAGDKFRNLSINIWDLEPGKYTLILLDTI